MMCMDIGTFKKKSSSEFKMKNKHSFLTVQIRLVLKYYYINTTEGITRLIIKSLLYFYKNIILYR